MKKLLTFFGVSLVTLSLHSQNADFSRELMHNTVRIDVAFTNGSIGTGTGFLFAFTNESNPHLFVPLLVTCRHVIKNSVYGRLIFTQWSSNTSSISTNKLVFEFQDFESRWIMHPDSNVDLCIMPITDVLQAAKGRHEIPYVKMFRPDQIPPESDWTNFSIFQEVKFIGYPIGIRDEKNNLPVARRGMIATDPAVDYNGDTKFLIDAAVFPGSSGSPVLIADEGDFQSGTTLMLGSRLLLVGIVAEVALYDSEGRVEIREIPSAYDMTAHIGIPANLGVVIKATRLKDFEPIIKEMIRLDTRLTNSVGK
jgi:hypothetical protein